MPNSTNPSQAVKPVPKNTVMKRLALLALAKKTEGKVESTSSSARKMRLSTISPPEGKPLPPTISQPPPQPARIVARMERSTAPSPEPLDRVDSPEPLDRVDSNRVEVDDYIFVEPPDEQAPDPEKERSSTK
ncbi:hypothetical protein L211DRAFT_852885 [Terfezia boudieri ATCC MYA-4762]|uniref:Uncharacterized protein n=1 Tax=Terfezia boudieri ATCC MYA-4762 TaxID=1051890 RepID=A0A3N4LA75_9PEZI|nr:hypothetical protein L211DRAFT_852885 [Terfezia boudieri ATCC MYA-4762]